MLTAYSASLIPCLNLSCHLFSNILAEYVICSYLLYQHCSEQDKFEDFQEDIQDF